MKLVTGVINPFKFDEVCASLLNMNLQDIYMVEAKGYGRKKGLKEHYHGTEYAVDYLNKIRFEVTVNDDQLSSAVEMIQIAANSGNIGDGKFLFMRLINSNRSAHYFLYVHKFISMGGNHESL